MSVPIDLYRIVYGDLIWTMTSADTEQVYNAGSGNETYVPVAMGRNGFEQKNELSKANMEVNLPIDHELSLNLLTGYSEQIISLTMFQKEGATVGVAWKGRLASIKPSDTKLTLVFESIFTSLRRPGLRARFQKSCRHALYGRGCTLDPEDFADSGTCTGLSGTTLTVTEADAQADGFYIGGMCRASDGSLAYIINHVGSAITLQRVPYAILQDVAGGFPFSVTLYPGCDHTRATCLAKFNNLLNYGGFDWIPKKNPMGGSSIV